jgi:hypothetical protein
LNVNNIKLIFPLYYCDKKSLTNRKGQKDKRTKGQTTIIKTPHIKKNFS